MKYEDHTKYFTYEEGLKAGDKVLLDFRLPLVIDGEKVEVTGQLPFFLKHGEYKSSEFFGLDEPEQMKILAFYKSVQGKLNEDLDDEGLGRRTLAVFMLGCYCFPEIHPKTPAFIRLCIALFTSLSFDDTMDDLDLDEFQEYNDLPTALPKLLRLFERVEETGDMEAFTESFRLAYPLGQKESLLTKEVYAEYPDTEENRICDKGRLYFRETFNTFTCTHLLMSPEVVESLDAEARLVMVGCNKAYGPVLEARMNFYGEPLHPVIRESLVFQKVLETSKILDGLINDIRGLGKDLRENNWKDNSILLECQRKGISVVDSFHNQMGLFSKKFRLLSTLIGVLEKSFPAEKGLQNYLRIIKDSYDGQIYGYFAFGYLRYGGKAGEGCKIVKAD